jgi:hypothetical protein
MQSVEATLLISAGFVGILTLFVLFSTGSLIAVFALWVVTAMIVLVLWYYGFIDMSVLSSTSAPSATPPPPAPKPAATTATPTGPQVGSEVFHIEDAQFTYADAPAVCAAYGAELATLEQIIDAYNHGAEWCGYGWSAGGMALYPTQKGTWDALQGETDQKKRTACNRECPPIKISVSISIFYVIDEKWNSNERPQPEPPIGESGRDRGKDKRQFKGS